MKHGVSHIDAGLSLKRPGAGKHFIKQHAGGKDVRPRIHFIAPCLLGSSVGRRTVRNAKLG